ncbi:murein hydrolase activator EnvC family protein [Gilvimarinus polysaccharolyticus]|uniref:murein hydrolase activator EnvC family protein n=1 Tax=Gilvimarinus polysaccharolyticus TaxID=863921 RepID=UPI0006738BC3|nr:peptidoglycan DD-metalloendopeptidase family protein [Gilvimarinus polysaccharolyticus]
MLLPLLTQALIANAKSPLPVRRVLGIWCLFLLCLAALLVPSVEAADDAAEYQKKLKALQSNIEQLKKELNDVKDQRGQLQQDLEQSETKIGELEEKVETINDEIKTQDADLQSLQQQQRTLEGNRQVQRTQIASQVRNAYRSGPQSPLRLLLNQQSPERITRLSKYHDYLLATRNDKLKSYVATLEKLSQLKPQIIAQRDGLHEQRKQLSARQRQLTEQQKARTSTLAKLAQVIDNKDAQLVAERQDGKRLQALLDEMTTSIGQAAPAGTAFSRLRGQLPWPTDGKLRHRYGSDRVGNQLAWEGIVIDASTGTPVQAVHSGHVIFAEYLRGHGLLIIVDHGEGYMSLYAHNQTLLKRPGDPVRGGEIIARVGDSGGQSYSGLYFEIRHNGQPTNPSTWLGRA